MNLIPAYRQAANQCRQRQRAWICGGAMYSALLLGTCLGIRFALRLSPEQTAAAQELTHTAARLIELDGALNKVKGALLEAKLSRETAEAIIDQPDWSILLVVLSGEAGDQIILREIRLKPESMAIVSRPHDQQIQRFDLELRGFGLSQPVVSQFVLRLQQLGLFEDVKLSRTGREPVLDVSAVSFEIVCRIGEVGRGGTP